MKKNNYRQDFKIISVDEERYIYYVPKGILMRTDDEELLSCCLSIEKKTSSLESKKYFNSLMNACKQGPKPIFRNSSYGFRDIILNISGHCNLRCPYCFARDGGNFAFDDFTLEQAIATINYCIKNDSGRNEFNICFFGGEPLLKFHLIKKISKELTIRFPYKSFKYSMTTNATLITDEVIDYFKENNFSVLVSFDGLENNRPFVNMESSSRVVLNNIRRLQNAGINITIRATLLQSSTKLYENFVFLESLGVNFECVFACATASDETNISDYSQVSRENTYPQLKQIVDYYKFSILQGNKVNCQTILKKIVEMNLKIFSKYACSAGRNMFTFNNNGDIYSCQNNASGKKLLCGNISNSIDKRTFQKSASPIYYKIENCKDCWARYLCSGGCMSEKLAMNIDRNKNMREKCEFEKMYLELLLYLTASLSEAVPSFFERYYNIIQEQLSEN